MVSQVFSAILPETQWNEVIKLKIGTLNMKVSCLVWHNVHKLDSEFFLEAWIVRQQIAAPLSLPIVSCLRVSLQFSIVR